MFRTTLNTISLKPRETKSRFTIAEPPLRGSKKRLPSVKKSVSPDLRTSEEVYSVEVFDEEITLQYRAHEGITRVDGKSSKGFLFEEIIIGTVYHCVAGRGGRWRTKGWDRRPALSLYAAIKAALNWT